MKKKVMIGICVLLAIVLLVPIPMRLKDGGTVVLSLIHICKGDHCRRQSAAPHPSPTPLRNGRWRQCW